MVVAVAVAVVAVAEMPTVSTGTRRSSCRAHNPRIFYAGGNYVFRSIKQGTELHIISPEITRTKRGSATALAESPRNPDVLWVGTDDGALWVTRDGGVKWDNVTDKVGLAGPRARVATAWKPSRTVEGRCYAAFDGHRSDDDEPLVYVTEDFGKTWKSLRGNLPTGSTRQACGEVSGKSPTCSTWAPSLRVVERRSIAGCRGPRSTATCRPSRSTSWPSIRSRARSWRRRMKRSLLDPGRVSDPADVRRDVQGQGDPVSSRTGDAVACGTGTGSVAGRATAASPLCWREPAAAELRSRYVLECARRRR